LKQILRHAAWAVFGLDINLFLKDIKNLRMKKTRISILITLFILGSLVLSACSGAPMMNSWPGLSASEDAVYMAHAGKIYSINAQNGSVICSFPENADNAKPFYAAPAVNDNLIVAGNYGHMLYGLSQNCIEKDGKKTFEQKWVFDSKTGHFAGTPLVVEGVVLAPSSNNFLYAVVDGKEKWSFETQNALWATPASDGKVVYLPALDHHLYALNLADGKLLWKQDLGSALLSAPLLTKDGLLYVSAMQGEVFALKAADGSQVWKMDTGGRLWSAPVLHEDMLYVGNASGKAAALSVKDGKIAWEKDLASPIYGGGALIPNGVVFPTEGGTVVGLSFDGQQELWRKEINGKLYSTPVVAGETVTVAVLEGDKLAQAFNVSGVESWPFTAPK